MDTNNLLISVTLHVFLLFVFLSILFWTVISPTETKSFSSELDKSINDIDYQEIINYLHEQLIIEKKLVKDFELEIPSL